MWHLGEMSNCTTRTWPLPSRHTRSIKIVLNTTFSRPPNVNSEDIRKTWNVDVLETSPQDNIMDIFWVNIWTSWKHYSEDDAGFEISNLMHLSIGQVDCKNHLSECAIHLSEIYKANATYVKIRNTQSSVGQVLQVFHLSDCHFYSSQTIGRVML